MISLSKSRVPPYHSYRVGFSYDVNQKNNCDICPLGDGDGTQAVGGDEVACVDHGLVSSLSLCFLCSEEGGDGDQDGDPIRLVMPGIEARPVPHSPDT